MPNNFALFKQILHPFLPDIAVGVESTFNYYWLYDGCVEAGVPFYLGHAAYMKAIAGNKKKNDPLDAETIAHLMRSNLFPQVSVICWHFQFFMRPMILTVSQVRRTILPIAGLSVYKELRPAKTSTAETKRWEIPI